MQPPDYFSPIRDRTRERWEQLEGDQELAGPWRLLFEQVQRPRHVLSELLQNADDVGATRANATIKDGVFVFEHDGRDFTEEEFSSLCRFGFSNKRALHTVGFRGVGFKSTFSLGDAVDVTTPSLSVRFLRERFTEPVWVGDEADFAVPSVRTRVVVRIADENRLAELAKNLQEWVESPASLLFFANLKELTVCGVTLRKDLLGEGPVPRSERIALSGSTRAEVVLFRSEPLPFPEEAVDEIRQERNVEELELPPCHVDLVLGLPGDQGLYVVLPTQIALGLPFSCNAPFLQDPARGDIKSPSRSSTNRWLLQRVGELAGQAMISWLGDRGSDLDARAAAYGLVPEKPHEAESLSAECTNAIASSYADSVGAADFLLTSDGRLVAAKGCLAPPADSYQIWDPPELEEVFGRAGDHVLHESVERDACWRLSSWSWLNLLADDDLLERLSDGRRIPRPGSHAQLLLLWSRVERCLRDDWLGERRRNVRIIPMEGDDELLTVDDVVRLPKKSDAIDDESWAFLVELVRVIDRRWVEYLESTDKQDASAGTARELLRKLGFARSSDLPGVFRVACRSLMSRPVVGTDDYVRLTRLAAALDVEPPDEFACVTADSVVRQVDHGIVASQDPLLEDLLPEDWSRTHLLHDRYFSMHVACDDDRWRTWLVSERSPFCASVPLVKKQEYIWGRQKLVKLLDSRNAERPETYPYVTGDFDVHDYDFDEALLEYWAKKAERDDTVWMRVLISLLRAEQGYLARQSDARVLQTATTGRKKALQLNVFNAKWIDRLRRLSCLPDTHGRASLPAELHRRTPGTEPILGVEPFVSADLDSPRVSWLLDRLGVKNTATDFEGLLNRVRDLSTVSDIGPILAALVKWYGALDRVLARCGPDELAKAVEVFAEEALILTDVLEWTTSSEVFRQAGDLALLEVPLVHPAVNDLAMWSRLGVADRPTAGVVVAWLKGLTSGARLERGVARRVSSLVSSYPEPVWRECGHWLALDNTWAPVDSFRFRLTPRSLIRWSELSPRIRGKTADFRRLSRDVCDEPPFDVLPDLAAGVEYRLTRKPQAVVPVRKPWLPTLAGLLAQIELRDEEESRRVREAAVRLGNSTWLSFGIPRDIQVTPYVDGTPEGQPHSPSVLWHETSIYVAEGELAESFDEVVAELSRPFGNDSVTEAIKACLDRDGSFIRAYMTGHFELAEEVEPTGPPPSGRGDGSGSADSGVETGEVTFHDSPKSGGDPSLDGEGSPADGAEEDIEEDISGDDGGHRGKRKEPNLIALWTERNGYAYDENAGAYVCDADELRIAKGVSGSPFAWTVSDATGAIRGELWVSRQCLHDGVEMPAEVWNLIRAEPDHYSVLLLNDHKSPVMVRGGELVRKQQEGVVEVYPSKYRILEETRDQLLQEG